MRRTLQAFFSPCCRWRFDLFERNRNVHYRHDDACITVAHHQAGKVYARDATWAGGRAARCVANRVWWPTAHLASSIVLHVLSYIVIFVWRDDHLGFVHAPGFSFDVSPPEKYYTILVICQDPASLAAKEEPLAIYASTQKLYFLNGRLNGCDISDVGL